MNTFCLSSATIHNLSSTVYQIIVNIVCFCNHVDRGETYL